MNTKLISVTQSYITEKELSAEELIVYTARVSNPDNQLNTETSERLLKYLIKHKHWSPFEMVDVCMEIKTSRAIAAQILRHRSFSFQEFSQRYSEVNAIEGVLLRRQAEKNRQSSSEYFNPIISNSKLYEGDFYNVTAAQLIQAYFNNGISLYNKLLEAGVAKESARAILPLNTQTTIYMKGSLRSWLTYLNIRLDENTQLEHRHIAIEVAKVIREVFPMTTDALNNFNDNKGMFI